MDWLEETKKCLRTGLGLGLASVLVLGEEIKNNIKKWGKQILPEGDRKSVV